MSNQPSQGPDHQHNDSPWPGYQPPPQYGQPRYGETQYGQPQYGNAQYSNAQYGNPQYFGQQSYYGGPSEPKTLSIASMVCGIASVIMGWLILPQIAALITGHLALRREPSGKGMSITGLVLGYLCLLGYGALWLLAIIGLALATSGGTSGTF